MLFFLQRDSPSAGCTRQTPPNRVSADSPSRILPGDIMVSLRFPPPEKLQRCEWSGRNSWIYFGRSLEGCGIYFFLKAAGGTRVQAVIPKKVKFIKIFLIRNPSLLKDHKYFCLTLKSLRQPASLFCWFYFIWLFYVLSCDVVVASSLRLNPCIILSFIFLIQPTSFSPILKIPQP